MRFKGKVAVVTGAASGIGLHTARRLAAEGAIVVVNDLREDAAESAAEAIRIDGGTAFALRGDVSDPEQVRSNADEVMRRYGRIDVLVNNAGMIDYGPATEVAPERWRRIQSVNTDGMFFWCQAAAVSSMIPRAMGSIVNVASTAGLAGIPQNVGYVASKHAVIGVTKALAVEWSRMGVRVNCVCPGLTETEMVRTVAERNPSMWADRRKRIPVGRASAPEEQAAAIAFLASDEASYVTGLVMNVDGGQMALFSGYSLP